MNTNPFQPPSTSTSAPPNGPAVPVRFSGWAIAGMTTAAILGIFYLFVFAASIYECATLAAPGLKSIGYVREGALAAIFVVLCFVTFLNFVAERRRAVLWLCICPVLLVVFIYPGTSAVFSFFETLVS